MFDFLLVIIKQIEFHTAELCAGSTVGTAVKAMLGNIAYARIAYTQGTMHKDFKIHIGYLMVDFCNLSGRKFTRQDSPFETNVLQPPHFFGRAVIGLSRCMQLHLKRFLVIPFCNQFQNAHILHQ